MSNWFDFEIYLLVVVIINKAKIDLWWSFGQVSSDLFLSFGGGSSGKYEKAIHTQHNLRTNRSSYKMNFMINLLYDHICAVHWRRLKWKDMRGFFPKNEEEWKPSALQEWTLGSTCMITFTYQPSEEILVSIIEVFICVPYQTGSPL